MSSYKDFLNQSIIGSHLEKYPLFNEFNSFILSFTLLAYPLNLISKLTLDIKSLVKNYLPFIIKITDSLEKWIVSIVFINTLEFWVPSSKSVQYKDLTFKNTKEYIENLETTKYILNSDAVHSIENFGNYGLRLTNERILSPIVEYVSKTKPHFIAESSEFEKSKKLVKDLYHSLRAKPYEIQNHITKVYEEERSKTEEGLKSLRGKGEVYVGEISNRLNSGLTKVKETVGVNTTNSKVQEQVNGVAHGIEQVNNGVSSAIEAN